jgi:two-component system, OmpR family, copper resistance phosphate regulon response regulator CusR
MRILVAARDVTLGAFLQREFDAEHFSVDLVVDGEQAKSLVQKRSYDAAVLDINLRRPDDLDVLKELRARQEQLPILLLTVRVRPEDHAQMLGLGADDFVLKPFAFAELSARVQALVRRGVHHADAVLQVDDLELSRLDHSVVRAGRKIMLTPKEFALLEYLMRNAGRHVTRTQIFQHVWNLTSDKMTNVVDVYINYLRRKVDPSPDCKLIHTVRGVGYRLQARPQHSPAAS